MKQSLTTKATNHTLTIAISALIFMVSAAYADPLPALPPVPADNPMTLQKVELGKQLFFDPRMSQDGSVSCNSCHNVMGGGTDNMPTSVGVNAKRGGRSAPTASRRAAVPPIPR